jgi:N-acyl-phosphatidylethanolamine-hydrolysing phospholipase D
MELLETLKVVLLDLVILNFHTQHSVKRKKKLDLTYPSEHVVSQEKVLSDLNNLKDNNYIAWIGHATFLIKLGDTTIITDPLFSKNAGPLSIWT